MLIRLFLIIAHSNRGQYDAVAHLDSSQLGVALGQTKVHPVLTSSHGKLNCRCSRTRTRNTHKSSRNNVLLPDQLALAIVIHKLGS